MTRNDLIAAVAMEFYLGKITHKEWDLRMTVISGSEEYQLDRLAVTWGLLA